MYLIAFILAVVCTVLVCLSFLLIQWVITQIGALMFAVILMVMVLVFWLGGEKRDGK